MAQAVQLKNDMFLDSSSVNLDRERLDNVMNPHLVGTTPNAMVLRRDASAITGIDFDQYRNPGIYAVYGQCVNAPLNGLAMHDGYGTLTVIAYSSEHCTQILQASKWDGSVNQVWIRSRDGGNQVWMPWQTIQITSGEGGDHLGWYTKRDCHCNRFQVGNGDNYCIIRTPVHAFTQTFNRIKIEGYAYRNQTPIHIEVCWYNYYNSGTWMPINYGWIGHGPDSVRLAMHQDNTGTFNWLEFHFPADCYFLFFVVTEQSSSHRSSVYRTSGAWHSYSSQTAASFNNYIVTVPKRD